MSGSQDGDGDYERLFETVESHIDECGYHLTYVDEEPPFCYSIGLTGTWGHPELLVYGLSLDDSATVLGGIVEQVRRGRRFAHGEVDASTFNRPVAFLAIPPDECFGRFVLTIEYYGLDFESLQVVTPDGLGRFPWSSDCAPGTVKAQPLIGRPLPAIG
jgi:Domain of unknown function (DUF4262)